MEYLIFVQKVINTLWNHKIFSGHFVPKKWYEGIKTSLTERYKQCAAKQDLAIVKSQRKRTKKKKPVVHNASLELDERFVRIENGHNSFDLWIKLSISNGIMKFYKRKHSHLIIKELINRELKEIDFSKMRTLVVERLKDVKKEGSTHASR